MVYILYDMYNMFVHVTLLYLGTRVKLHIIMLPWDAQWTREILNALIPSANERPDPRSNDQWEAPAILIPVSCVDLRTPNWILLH